MARSDYIPFIYEDDWEEAVSGGRDYLIYYDYRFYKRRSFGFIIRIFPAPPSAPFWPLTGRRSRFLDSMTIVFPESFIPGEDISPDFFSSDEVAVLPWLKLFPKSLIAEDPPTI